MEGHEALQRALTLDSTLCLDPARLRRALRDWLPFDERLVQRIALGADVGAAALVTTGQSAEAVARLADLSGMRPAAAHEVIRAWSDALGSGPGEPFGTTNGVAAPAVADAPLSGDAPTGVAMVRLLDVAGLWVVATGGQDGFYAACIGDEGRVFGSWRQLATPAGPLARDVALTTAGPRAGVAWWSDRLGIYASQLGLDTDPDAGRALHIGPAQRMVETKDARYPIAATADQGASDVFWSPDRQTVTGVAITAGGSCSEAKPIPTPCHGRERLVGLDVVRAGTCGWLVALTDAGRVLLSPWDLPTDQHNMWISGAAPLAGVAASAVVVTPAGAVVVVVFSGDGHLFLLRLRREPGEAWPWRSLGIPAGLPGQPAVRSLAAAAMGDGHLLLAVVTRSGTWSLLIDERGDRYGLVGQAERLLA
jgi:hypothetical protein